MALILASSSAIRRSMLRAAGVEFELVPAHLDEGAIKAELSEPVEMARKLAAAKALAVSRERSGDMIIGSDSIVSCADHLFDKPRDRAEAAAHLRFFSGNPMELMSGVVLAKDGVVSWHHVETAVLWVRTLSDEFIADYLDAEWPEVGHTVGVFRLEGRGVQLFDRVEGDHFTILGMPLIPLLGALRQQGIIGS